MRTRPVLHEAENVAETKTYEAEATKFGLDPCFHGLLEGIEQCRVA